MFNIFKKRSEKKKLQAQYSRLMMESHKLSHVYRRLGDSKLHEAYRIRQVLEKMD